MARTKKRVSAKKPQFGANKPFSQKRTRRKFKVNMQNKRIYVPELGRTVRVKVAASEIRTIDKIGLPEFLKRRGISLNKLAQSQNIVIE
jgi:large subunit ribosomal protein L28